MGIGVTVALRFLVPSVQVQILDPQFQRSSPRLAGAIVVSDRTARGRVKRSQRTQTFFTAEVTVGSPDEGVNRTRKSNPLAPSMSMSRSFRLMVKL